MLVLIVQEVGGGGEGDIPPCLGAAQHRRGPCLTDKATGMSGQVSSIIYLFESKSLGPLALGSKEGCSGPYPAFLSSSLLSSAGRLLAETCGTFALAPGFDARGPFLLSGYRRDACAPGDPCGGPGHAPWSSLKRYQDDISCHA